MQSEETLTQLAAFDRDAIENAIREIYLLWLEERFDALDRFLAPNAVFEYAGNQPGFPFAGRYFGKKNIIDLYRRMNTELEMLECERFETIIDGQSAFSRRIVCVRHRGTGASETHEIWDIWRFRDGLVESSIKLIDISAYKRLQN